MMLRAWIAPRALASWTAIFVTCAGSISNLRAQLERERHHPLTQRRVGEHAIDQGRGLVAHAARSAARAWVIVEMTEGIEPF